MNNEKKIKEVLERIYQAATQPDDWANIICDLAPFFGASMGQVFVDSFYGDNDHLNYSMPVDQKCLEDFFSYYAQYDPRIAAVARNPGLPMTREMMISERELFRSEIYNDFLVPWELEQVLGIQIPTTSRKPSFLAVLRPEGAGAYGQEDQKMLVFLASHIQQSLRILHKFSSLKIRNTGLVAALELAQSAIIILDSGGRATFINGRAQDLIDARDGLCLDRSGALTAARTTDSAGLTSAILKIVRGGNGVQRFSGTVLKVFRPSLRRPYEVMVTPFSHGLTVFGHTRMSALLLIEDPERKIKTRVERFQSFYGLTPAEARLLSAFIEEESIKNAATRLSITEGTARVTMKQIFGKTGVNSQVALMKLVLSKPAAFFRVEPKAGP